MDLIRWLFSWKLKRKLKNDPEFLKSVDEADKAMERLQESIRKAEANGTKIPDSLKRYAGMKP